MARSEFTTDRDDVERWAKQHDAVPVREAGRIELVPEDEQTPDQERIDWETFHRHVDDNDQVVVYHGDTGDRRPFELSKRTEALDRAEFGEAHDRDRVEERLRRGETIEGTVTESRVGERGSATDPGREGGAADATAATGTTDESATGRIGDDDADVRTVPDDDDVGKQVVVASGDDIGMVTEVEGTTAYVDPHPGMTEKIMAKLGWGDRSAEDLALQADRIAAITDDEVRLTGDYDEEALEDTR